MKNGFLVLLLAIGAAATAQAQTTFGTLNYNGHSANTVWEGGTSTGSNFDFETAANWNPAAVPTENATVADDLYFNIPGAATTVYMTAPENASQVDFQTGAYTISGASTSDTLSLVTPGTGANGSFVSTIFVAAADNGATAPANVINVAVNLYSYDNTGTSKIYNPEISLAATSGGAGTVSGTLQFNGMVTDEASTLLEVTGGTGSGTVTFNGGFTNDDAVEFVGGTQTFSGTTALAPSSAATGTYIKFIGTAGSANESLNLNSASSLAATSLNNVSVGGVPITINFGAAQALVGATNNSVVGKTNIVQNGSALTMNFQGNSQTFGLLTLTSGTLNFNLSGDLNNAGTTLDFLDSSGQTWTSNLVITGYTQGQDIINFGDSTGLTSGQLADISLDGTSATLDSSGNLVVAPEPSTWSLMIMGAFGLMGVVVRARRKSMF